MHSELGHPCDNLTPQMYLQAIYQRYFNNLTFQELRRSIQVLSSLYVERRQELRKKGIAGRGKRAAFALYYGALHFLAVQDLVSKLALDVLLLTDIVDLGCGTLATGIAWTMAMKKPPRLLGIEQQAWAANEARWAIQTTGLHGNVRVGDIVTTPWKGERVGVLCAFILNELDDSERDKMANTLLVQEKPNRVTLVIEPIGNRTTPWWPIWKERVLLKNGREDVWALDLALPDWLQNLERASGLNHQPYKVKTLCWNTLQG